MVGLQVAGCGPDLSEEMSVSVYLIMILCEQVVQGYTLLGRNAN